MRDIGKGLHVTKGPFSRPVTRSDFERNDDAEAAIKRLRRISQSRLDIRSEPPQSLGYFILVPTLRCNLSCDYCQVSRAAEGARGFDWSDEVLEAVVEMISTTTQSTPTVEVQGGEPLLRLDLVKEVRARLQARGLKPKFVICTNLQRVSDESWHFLAEPDVLISTSFDGTWEAHDRHRTMQPERLGEFRANLTRALADFGSEKVSVTSTIDPAVAPDPEEIFGAMRGLGVATMFVRPVNYQGFARKAFREVQNDDAWDDYYLHFIEQLIAHNERHDMALSEYYFAYILRRVLDPRHSHHVDLRNPNPLGWDYVVIDEKGNLFPTDEARMLHRAGQIDLRIGTVFTGIDRPTVAQLNAHCDNRTDPACSKCVYQAVCGRDLIDDISRYGRIDLPRQETRHCRRHLSIFDFVMRKLATASRAELGILARMVGLRELDVTIYRVPSV